MDVLFSKVDVVQPEFLFVSSARSSIITECNIQGTPDLVVEILSAGTRKTDEGIKRTLYERAQVPEYWIIDPQSETVKIYHLHREGHYGPAQEFTTKTDQAAITTPLLPGVSLPLHEIFS